MFFKFYTLDNKYIIINMDNVNYIQENSQFHFDEEIYGLEINFINTKTEFFPIAKDKENYINIIDKIFNTFENFKTFLDNNSTQ